MYYFVTVSRNKTSDDMLSRWPLAKEVSLCRTGPFCLSSSPDYQWPDMWNLNDNVLCCLDVVFCGGDGRKRTERLTNDVLAVTHCYFYAIQSTFCADIVCISVSRLDILPTESQKCAAWLLEWFV